MNKLLLNISLTFSTQNLGARCSDEVWIREPLTSVAVLDGHKPYRWGHQGRYQKPGIQDGFSKFQDHWLIPVHPVWCLEKVQVYITGTILNHPWNSRFSHLKMDGWKTIISCLRDVNGQICRQTMPTDHLLSFVVTWFVHVRGPFGGEFCRLRGSGWNNSITLKWISMDF